MLWGGDDAEARLRELLRARRAQYAEIPHHLDTTAHTVAQVAEEVLALYAAQPRTWRVSAPSGSYPVHLARGGIGQLGALLRAREVGDNLAVVSDANVWPHWGEPLLAGLRGSGYAPEVIVLPAGEEQKHLDNVRLLYDRLAVAGVDRGAAVLALGGGVITDMAGFAAATFMRGVPLVPVPTTLLGMIDAAIGGKVAVDHPRGKNLIGAFVQPLLVMLDPDTLATLPDQERRAGLAEIIKAGVIADPTLFTALEAGAPSADLRWEIERAIAVKIAVVEEDPYEQGRRAVLNLGHTFAHAIEVLSSYRLHHGLAVSIGMAAAARLAELRGVGTAALSERIISTLTRHGLPTTYEEHPPAAVYQAMRADKKRRGGTPRLVLPRAIGEVVVVSDVTETEIIAALERIRP
jgi:3-dehydroquinate synthase